MELILLARVFFIQLHPEEIKFEVIFPHISKAIYKKMENTFAADHNWLEQSEHLRYIFKRYNGNFTFNWVY